MKNYISKSLILFQNKQINKKFNKKFNKKLIKIKMNIVKMINLIIEKFNKPSKFFMKIILAQLMDF